MASRRTKTGCRRSASAARAAGATRLMLEVRAGNQAAQALYQRAGFVVTGRRKVCTHGEPELAGAY